MDYDGKKDQFKSMDYECAIYIDSHWIFHSDPDEPMRKKKAFDFGRTESKNPKNSSIGLWTRTLPNGEETIDPVVCREEIEGFRKPKQRKAQSL